MTTRTRRRFLEDSLMAAAAAAIAPAAMATAAEDKQSSSPSEKLAVAVVGVRGRGNSHIGAFVNRKDTEITIICDADKAVGEKRADEIAKKQGRRPKFVQDLREALEDKSLDIVSIATPNYWHALGAIWSIQAGKDVYVEKPVSHNVSEGRRIVEAARKYKKICQTGTQCRSMKGTIDAIEYVQSGKIGEVKLARGLCHRLRRPIGKPGNYPPPKSVDYSLYLGPAQMAPVTRPQFHYDWHWQSPYGNGDLGNQGIHQMDIARWGLGLDQLSNRVVSYGGRLGKGWDCDAGDTANTNVTIHEFGDKTLVFEVRNMKTPKFLDSHVGVIFYGTEGYVVTQSYSNAVVLDKDQKVVKKFNGGGDHFANFIKAVRSRKHTDLTADILEGHLSSALCHTGNASYYQGKKTSVADMKKWANAYQGDENAVDTLDRTLAYLADNKVDLKKTPLALGPQLTFNPKDETFVDNEVASQTLTRNYRKPFVVPKAGEV